MLKVLSVHWASADEACRVADNWGKVMAAPVTEKGSSALASFSWDAVRNPEVLALAGMTPAAGLPLSADNFGLGEAADGLVRVVWSQAEGMFLEEAAPVFQLTFTVLEGGSRLSEVLGLDEDILPGRAYTSALNEAGILLHFSGLTGTADPMDSGVQLLQNRPNPFTEHTVIGFVLPEAGEAQLRVFDAAGRLLAERHRHYPAGKSEESFDLFHAPGMLYYELTTLAGSLTRTMTILRP